VSVSSLPGQAARVMLGAVGAFAEVYHPTRSLVECFRLELCEQRQCSLVAPGCGHDALLSLLLGDVPSRLDAGSEPRAAAGFGPSHPHPGHPHP
jgi:hypothetical protein